MKLFPALVLTLFVSWSTGHANGQHLPDPLFGLGEREIFEIEARALGRSFHVIARLPRSYSESERDYPMALLLDGGILFPMLAPFQLMMEVQDSAREVILVGVSYGGLGFSNGNLRGTDFTAPSSQVDYFGGAEAFQSFLAEELLPELFERYRIESSRTLLLGQSLGGQFAIHAALNHPGLFSTLVAVNPALHANLEHFLDAQPAETGSKSRLVVAIGSEEEPRFRVPALQWIDTWSRRDEKPFELDVIHLPGGHHATSAPAAYFEVIRSAFPASPGT